MKNVKMSLENIQGKLSRTELKKIMAGSQGCQYGNSNIAYCNTQGCQFTAGGYCCISNPSNCSRIP